MILKNNPLLKRIPEEVAADKANHQAMVQAMIDGMAEENHKHNQTD